MATDINTLSPLRLSSLNKSLYEIKKPVKNTGHKFK